MKVLIRLVIGASLMFASIANANVILSLDTTQTYAHPGDIVSVTVMIDGLGDFVPLSLSAYDIWIEFDTSVLSFIGYSLFDNLGGVADSEDYSLGNSFNPNFVNISESSYLTGFDDLWASQPASFALAKLLFTVNPLAGNQTTALSFADWELLDAGGSPDPINVIGLNNASIEVPSPAILMLIIFALLTIFVREKHFTSGIRNP
jgi:hypothetical protein